MYMARRILLACLACFWFQFIFSQSMSDDQVVRYVMEQQEKGKDTGLKPETEWLYDSFAT